MEESKLQVGDMAMVMRLLDGEEDHPDAARLGDVVEIIELNEGDEDGLIYYGVGETAAQWFYAKELEEVVMIAEIEFTLIEGSDNE